MESPAVIQIRPIKPRRVSMAERILDHIESLPGGMRTKYIQRELYRMSHPDDPFCKGMSRGWWCTQLFGRRGLLHFYCERRDGRWHRRKNRPHCGSPFKTIRMFNRHTVIPGGSMVRYTPHVIAPMGMTSLTMAVV